MRYNINDINFKKLFLEIQQDIKNNSETLNDLQKIDYKYCKMKTDLEQLINILDNFKNEKIYTEKEQKISVIYNGDPLITLNLSLLAILTKSIIILEFENFIGVNSQIIEIVNNVLNKFETDKMIYIADKDQENIDKIICIDDINKYNEYLRKKNSKAKFYSFNYLDFYSDSDEFEEIEELIYKIAGENQIPIESYSELPIEDAIQMMKNGLGKRAVILTNNRKTKQNFEEILKKNKKLYINKNPFEENQKIINKDIIFM